LGDIMKTIHLGMITLLLLPLTLLGCSSAALDSDGTSGIPEAVVCETFYRPGPGQPLATAPPISLEGNQRRGETFAAMAFEAFYQEDEFEGRALSVVVMDLETGREISRQLYQFDPQNPPENQFIGGHGFTGLNYVFQSGSNAELQYFCSIKSE
jgi:hypothetical protein